MQSARDERIPGKLICAIVAVGSLAFFGILTETVMNVLFPQLMGVLHISEATIQWLTTGYLLVVSITVPLSAWLRRRFRQRSIFLRQRDVLHAAAVHGCGRHHCGGLP